jgi:hypothetical protein
MMNGRFRRVAPAVLTMGIRRLMRLPVLHAAERVQSLADLLGS